jgi:hypothetical protein
MYVHTNEELNQILADEGFWADLDETQEMELQTEQIIYDDEFQGEKL